LSPAVGRRWMSPTITVPPLRDTSHRALGGVLWLVSRRPMTNCSVAFHRSSERMANIFCRPAIARLSKWMWVKRGYHPAIGAAGCGGAVPLMRWSTLSMEARAAVTAADSSAMRLLCTAPSRASLTVMGRVQSATRPRPTVGRRRLVLLPALLRSDLGVGGDLEGLVPAGKPLAIAVHRPGTEAKAGRGVGGDELGLVGRRESLVDLRVEPGVDPLLSSGDPGSHAGIL
jgi:hypothetical protein